MAGSLLPEQVAVDEGEVGEAAGEQIHVEDLEVVRRYVGREHLGQGQRQAWGVELQTKVAERRFREVYNHGTVKAPTRATTQQLTDCHSPMMMRILA